MLAPHKLDPDAEAVTLMVEWKNGEVNALPVLAYSMQQAFDAVLYHMEYGDYQTVESYTLVFE